MKHEAEIDRAFALYRIAQRILRAHKFKLCRLAMIPFGPVAMAVGTNDAVPCRDLMPFLRIGASGPAYPGHIDCEPVGVQRVEFVSEPADAEDGRAVGGMDAGALQRPRFALPQSRRRDALQIPGAAVRWLIPAPVEPWFHPA